MAGKYCSHRLLPEIGDRTLEWLEDRRVVPPAPRCRLISHVPLIHFIWYLTANSATPRWYLGLTLDASVARYYDGCTREEMVNYYTGLAGLSPSVHTAI